MIETKLTKSENGHEIHPPQLLKMFKVKCDHVMNFMECKIMSRNKNCVPSTTPAAHMNKFNSRNFDIAGESAESKYSYFHENYRALYDQWFINSRTTSTNSILRSDWISLSLAKSSDVKNILY